MEQKEFFELAKETFGNKVNVNVLTISDEELEKLNKSYGTYFSKSDIFAYGKHVWLIGDDCPHCGESLFGLFGGFQWGIVHGEGYCSNCDKVAFRYYHYVLDGSKPLQLFSVVGF